MRHPSFTLAAALAVSSLLPACVSDGVDDELAGEGDDGEAGKDDSNGTFTFHQLSLEPRVSPNDAGFIASRANRTTIPCGSSASAATCFVRSLDWSGTGLSDETSTVLEQSLRSGMQILLRGETAPETADTRNLRMSRSASKHLAGSFASNTLGPSQPMLSVGAENGPDCLYANVEVKNVVVGRASVQMTTVGDEMRVSVVLDTVDIAATSTFAVSCVNGTAPLAIAIDRIELAGTVQPGSPALPTLTPMAVTGLTVTDTGHPSTVIDMLGIRDGGAAKIVATTAGVLLQPLSAAEMPGQLQLSATEAWLPMGDGETESEDVFVLAKKEGARIRERRLNSTRSALIDLIDFDASGASMEQISDGQEAVATDGVILAGPRYTKAGRPGRRAVRFWMRAQD